MQLSRLQTNSSKTHQGLKKDRILSEKRKSIAHFHRSWRTCPVDRVICGKDPSTVNRKSCSREVTLSFKPVPIVLCLAQIFVFTAKCRYVCVCLFWKCRISFVCLFVWLIHLFCRDSGTTESFWTLPTTFWKDLSCLGALRAALYCRESFWPFWESKALRFFRSVDSHLR